MARIRYRPLAAAAVALTLGACSRGPADEPQTPSTAPDSAPDAAADSAAHAAPTDDVRWLTPPDVDCGEPTGCVDTAGRPWIAWLEFDGSAASLQLTCLADPSADAEALVRAELCPPGAGLAYPRLAAFGDGAFAVWERRLDGRQEIVGQSLRLEAGHLVSGPLEVLSADGIEPALCALGDGGLALAWQSFNGRDFDVSWRARGADGWGPERIADASACDAWGPQLAADAAGRFWITWDTFALGHDPGADAPASFDVLLHGPLDADSTSAPTVRALSGPEYTAFARPTVDARGRVWIAAESAPDFGRGGPLRPERRLRLACFDPAEGTWRDAELNGAAADGAQLPRLRAAPDGLLACAHVLQPPNDVPANNPLNQSPARTYSSWTTRVLDLAGHPQKSRELEPAIAGNEASECLLALPDGGALLLFSADQRTRYFGEVERWAQPVERTWRIGAVHLPAPTGWPALGPPRTPAPGPEDRHAPRFEPRPNSPDGWMFGDLHRHTHLSRCAADHDGLRVDQYRYAFGPGDLDYVALADHFQHLTPWSWWRSLRDVERFHRPPRLVVLAGLERNVIGHGHQNLIYVDPAQAALDDPAWLEEVDSPSAFRAPEVTAIPHMANRENGWFPLDELDPALHRVVELYQSARGSYEGLGLPHMATDQRIGPRGAREFLGSGLPLGWIASSDHGESADALGVLQTGERTRAGVMRALCERASLAATARASATCSLGELQGGESGAVPADAAFEVQVLEAPSPVAYVELVRAGETLAREDVAPSGALERVQIAFKYPDARPDAPVQLEVLGGRIVEHHARRPEGALTGLRLQSPTELSMWTGARQLDAVLLLEREAPDAELALRLTLQETSDPLVVDSIPIARARQFRGTGGRRATLWRMGPVAAEPGSAPAEARMQFRFEGLEWEAGDAVYARVAFTDSNMLWLSPVFISAVER